MEKRLIIAIALSFIVLFAWQAIFVRQAPPQTDQENRMDSSQPDPQSTQDPALPLKTVPAEPSEALQQKEPLITEKEAVSAEQKRDIIIETPLYRAVWSNQGGVLKSWRLKQHKDENGDDLELVSQVSQEINRFPMALLTGDAQFDQQINSALFKATPTRIDLQGNETREVSFVYADESGNRVEKRLIFWAGGYDFEILVKAWKLGEPLQPYLVWGPQFGNLSAGSGSARMGGAPGVSVYAGGKVIRQTERKYDPEKSTYNFVGWAGYDDQYFMALLIATSQQSSAMFVRESEDQVPLHYLGVNYVQKVYIGPKQYDILSGLGHEAKRAIRFGLFGFITEILYVAIKAIHKTFPNWGWCIILLTFVIKIIFFPLTYSSTKSMARMQELQPKIKALRSKYKKAKQDIEQRRKLNEETMRLYKEHGVNPAGGCLPILIQLPIFWGFFQLLRVAVEFRHSPWIFWINDLSVKDPIYVIPILMGITQFISQKMTPTSADASQQKMMLIMPVIMTVFFIGFPAGLVLYWLTNNVLQIGQQYIMNRFKSKQVKESHAKRRKK